MYPIRLFRAIAVAEAISWLALIVATVVKYSAHAPVGVKILGPVHGVLFLIYVAMAIVGRARLDWPLRTTVIVLADSVIPAGGLVVARRADIAGRVAAGAAASRG